jgi:putative sigma-54 modulation protein
MHLTIKGRGMQVSEYLEDTVNKKAKKLERYFKPDTQMYVTLAIEKGRHICEVTIPFIGETLRTEEVSGDMYNSIDAALKKLERMIRKHRTKLEKRLHEKAYDYDTPVYEDIDDKEDVPAKIVKVKRFQVKPMDLDEAKLQMELIGHSFFVFTNADTGQVNVLYKRKDGDIGLLEPDYG